MYTSTAEKNNIDVQNLVLKNRPHFFLVGYSIGKTWNTMILTQILNDDVILPTLREVML